MSNTSNNKQRRHVNLVTLGCSKNLVDSERLLKMLADAGYDAHHEAKRVPHDAIVIINTCGFIGDAKEESINTILEWADAKVKGRIAKLFVMGCLSQRYLDVLPNEIPEVDRWYGKYDWAKIVTDLANLHPAAAPYDRIITTPRHHAYIKIAEGCNRHCAFCAIPIITGRYVSRPIEEIVQEVNTLVERGVKEFNIIAQDLSGYGLDIYHKQALPQLIDAIANIKGVQWIRLHYAYPAGFPMELLDVMERHQNVCRYIDIALQHVSDPVLNRMRRHINGQQTRELLAEMRRRVPGIHIRTTLMVGFPGETDEDFQQLMDFVRQQRFERMGAFAYCEEDDTFAALNLTDDVPPEVKQQRLDQLMELQQSISLELQQLKVGSTMRVIIDRDEPDHFVGRSQFDSPEVDTEVLIPKASLSQNKRLLRGHFYNVKITEALPFELIGNLADNN